MAAVTRAVTPMEGYHYAQEQANKSSESRKHICYLVKLYQLVSHREIAEIKSHIHKIALVEISRTNQPSHTQTY